MDTQREMPKYVCHKHVHALKIGRIIRENSTWFLEFVDEGYATIAVTDEWFNKHNPHAPGYYVVYADGYVSFSPAPAFEQGYTPA